MNYQRVVILKEKEAERYLPIWIGPAEADAISVTIQEVKLPRPLTHDLVCSIINALGASVNYVVVSDLQNDTFYAKLILNVDGEQIEVDSRPSDAIAIAVRTRVPIYTDEVVLDKAGVLLDQETGKPIAKHGGDEKAGSKSVVDEEELKRMSAFTDFIETLNLDDLDKGQS
jgi:hypothetical protein